MWLQHRLSLIQPLPAVLVFDAPLQYGVNHLIQQLASQSPLAWLELTEQDENDPVAQGNKLASVLNAAFGTQLFGFGLHFHFNLSVLKRHLHYLGRLNLAVTQADKSPELCRALLALQQPNCHVILQLNQPLTLPSPYRLLSADDLRLSWQEAAALTPVSQAECEDIYALTDGAYDHFLSEVQKRQNQEPHLLPGPAGFVSLPTYEVQQDPVELLTLLCRTDHWLEALELACQTLPERVTDILTEAGHVYHEQGLHQRLLKLLGGLPAELKGQEQVLYWRLQAAYRLGQENQLGTEVRSYLAQHEAPDLRALAAGTLLPFDAQEAKRAYLQKPTAFSAHQAGILDDSAAGLELLREALRLAEDGGRPYEEVRNAGALAAKLIHLGHYSEAVHWGDWALKTFQSKNIRDSQRKLLILNDWAYARILTGNTAGLEDLLREHEIYLEQAYPELALLFRSTLADFLLATERPEQALAYYRQNQAGASRRQLGWVSVGLVRVLLELGHSDEAVSVAEQALSLTGDQDSHAKLPAKLALGMALALHQPQAAREQLLAAQQGFRQPYAAYLIAQSSLYLALTYLASHDRSRALAILFEPANHLKALARTGLRLLSGPESHFRELWAELLGQAAPLELRLMGRAEVWYAGKKLELFPKWLEILTVLVLRGRELSLEELLSDLYGDGGSKAALKSHLSRLRQLLPISPHPYRLEVQYRVDFLEVLNHLQEGNLSEAVNLYRGALLTDSQSPRIREMDALLANSLREAALNQQRPEVLLHLSDHFPEDIELLEASQRSLPQADPRVPLLKAKLEYIKSSWLN